VRPSIGIAAQRHDRIPSTWAVPREATVRTIYTTAARAMVDARVVSAVPRRSATPTRVSAASTDHPRRPVQTQRKNA
jgi:hypothetical protein